MKTNTESIVDSNGIELLVEYEYDFSVGYYEEPNNIASFVESSVCTKLKEVELIISGKGISILPLLDERQKQSIISKLTYE